MREDIVGFLLAGYVLTAFFCFLFFFIYRKKAKQLKSSMEKEEMSLLMQKEQTQQIIDLEHKNQALLNRCEELRKSEEKSKKTASSDYITGLPNRGAFTEVLESVLKTLRKDEVFALMYVDVDDFKKINQTIGHAYGDELLIDITDRIRKVMDENNYLACFGGDEFAIITQNFEDTTVLDEKIKEIKEVFSFPFVLAAREVFITVSIGVCLAPVDGKSSQNLYKNLDTALSAAKNSGKNQVCFYDESMNQLLMEKIQLQSQIRAAIENKEFEVFFQPQIQLGVNQVAGFEALVRWNHPTRGILLPIEFLPTSEETGLILSIGELVIQKAILQLKAFLEAGFPSIHVSVNVSARQLKELDFLENIVTMLKEEGVEASCFEIEIKEEEFTENRDQWFLYLEKVKQSGIGIVLDNFGSGCSSIEDLMSIPFVRMKIGREFMDRISEDRTYYGVLSAVIGMARAFQTDVTVKGVESAEQEALLTKMECNSVQGFLYSEPIRQEETIELLRYLENGGKLDEFYWR